MRLSAVFLGGAGLSVFLLWATLALLGGDNERFLAALFAAPVVRELASGGNATQAGQPSPQNAQGLAAHLDRIQERQTRQRRLGKEPVSSSRKGTGPAALALFLLVSVGSAGLLLWRS